MRKELTAQLREYPAGPPSNAGVLKRPLDCQRTFRQITEDCAREIHRDRKFAVTGDSDVIHNMRIALTRLDAAALFFPPAIDDVAWSRIREQLRWLNSALGKARDHDVTMGYAKQKRYRGLGRKLAARLGAIARQGSSPARKKASFRSIPSPDLRARSMDRKTIQSTQQTTVPVRPDRRLQLGALAGVEKSNLPARMPSSIAGAQAATSPADPMQAVGDLRDLRRLRKAIHCRLPGYRKQKRKLLRKIENSFRSLRLQ